MWFFRSANNISTVWRKLHVSSEIAFQTEDVITVRNEVAKVMFLHLSVILFTGGGLPQYMLRYHPPGPGTPPRGADPPGADHPLDQAPPQSRHPPPADWNVFLFTFYNYKRNAFKRYTIQYKTN